jgi:two-component system response regulator CpxR
MIRPREPIVQKILPGVRKTIPGASILLIDDDAELGERLSAFFEPHGFRLEVVYEGRRGLSQALRGSHDLVLLDVMMPGVNGIEMLRQMRRRSSIPVIVLTAHTAQADRIECLDAGADDYVPKPFEFGELLARVRAVLRRAEGSWRIAAEVMEIGPIRLLPAMREAWCDERAIGLTALEFDILELLVRSAGRAVSRDELMIIVHQRRVTPFDRSLDVHVSHIRKKLGRRGSMIRTVRGVGYFCVIESREGIEP